jgi:SAM-dependent methyltransferase
MDNLGQWSSEFGREYTDRNVYDFTQRIPDFLKILPLDAKYILEVGSNYGNNLRAIETLGKKVIGIEPNDYARDNGRDCRIIEGNCYDIPFANNSFDLVFTCGVLIHIPPDKLEQAQKEIFRVSKKYILVIEYIGEDEVLDEFGMKLYRGKQDMLWKRKDYAFPNCELIGSGKLNDIWDNAEWRLFKKAEMNAEIA